MALYDAINGGMTQAQIIACLPTKLACTGYGKFDSGNQNGSGTLSFISLVTCVITITALTNTACYIKNNTTNTTIKTKNATLNVSQGDSLTFYVKTNNGTKGGTMSGALQWTWT